MLRLGVERSPMQRQTQSLGYGTLLKTLGLSAVLTAASVGPSMVHMVYGLRSSAVAADCSDHHCLEMGFNRGRVSHI